MGFWNNTIERFKRLTNETSDAVGKFTSETRNELEDEVSRKLADAKASFNELADRADRMRSGVMQRVKDAMNSAVNAVSDVAESAVEFNKKQVDSVVRFAGLISDNVKKASSNVASATVSAADRMRDLASTMSRNLADGAKRVATTGLHTAATAGVVAVGATVIGAAAAAESARLVIDKTKESVGEMVSAAKGAIANGVTSLVSTSDMVIASIDRRVTSAVETVSHASGVLAGTVVEFSEELKRNVQAGLDAMKENVRHTVEDAHRAAGDFKAVVQQSVSTALHRVNDGIAAVGAATRSATEAVADRISSLTEQAEKLKESTAAKVRAGLKVFVNTVNRKVRDSVHAVQGIPSNLASGLLAIKEEINTIIDNTNAAVTSTVEKVNESINTGDWMNIGLAHRVIDNLNQDSRLFNAAVVVGGKNMLTQELVNRGLGKTLATGFATDMAPVIAADILCDRINREIASATPVGKSLQKMFTEVSGYPDPAGALEILVSDLRNDTLRFSADHKAAALLSKLYDSMGIAEKAIENVNKRLESTMGERNMEELRVKAGVTEAIDEIKKALEKSMSGIPVADRISAQEIGKLDVVSTREFLKSVEENKKAAVPVDNPETFNSSILAQSM